MFLLADKYGETAALTVGYANEFRGLLFTDRNNGNMTEALWGLRARGGGPTAFEWSDLNNNGAGAEFWLNHRGRKSYWNPIDNPGLRITGPK